MNFSVTVYYPMNGIQLFEVAWVSFVSEKGQHMILPDHEPLFACICSCQIKLKTEHEEQEILVEKAGFCKFDGQNCEIWIS